MSRHHIAARTLLTALGMAAAVTLAAPAHAATTVGVRLNGAELRMSGSDFADDIEIGAESDGLTVTSRVATIFIGSDSGCERINGFKVRCRGATTIHAELGLGNDTFLNVTNRPGEISGNVGADNITGGAGDDTLRGGNGNDILDGAGGFDTVIGGNNFDTCIGENESLSCES
ncbi:hypothetical protein [Nocardia brasiliensis]